MGMSADGANGCDQSVSMEEDRIGDVDEDGDRRRTMGMGIG